MLVLIIFTAFLLRIIPLDFPNFSADETRIAYRGYTLTTNGTDELGRKFPIIFNSLSDYQLPLTSYITAAGIKFFGKSDFGARFPFILIGTLSVWFVYAVAWVFNPSRKFRLLSALIATFSPTLIFLSRIPNDTAVVTFLLLLLFYILIREKLNLLLVLVTLISLLLTSKIAWFILVPFTVFVLLILKKDFSSKSRLTIAISILLTVFVVFGFLKIPQALRSLNENNFPIFSDITIRNGIDKLRGQGIEEGWPPILSRVLFNKLSFVYVGFLHWLSHLQPAVFFSQFDPTDRFGLVGMGAWSKVLIIPLLASVLHIIRKVDVKAILLISFIVILTFPLIFVYQLKSPGTVALVLPYMAIFMTIGLVNFKKYIRYLILVFMVLEVLVNFTFFESQIKSTDQLRPGWVKEVVYDAYILSKRGDVALSDDIVDDPAPFIGWYTPVSLVKTPLTDFPYKVRLNQLSNIKLIGFDNNFRSCGIDEDIVLILSERDFNEVKQVFDVAIEKSYQDSIGEIKVYKLSSRICIQ